MKRMLDSAGIKGSEAATKGSKNKRRKSDQEGKEEEAQQAENL